MSIPETVRRESAATLRHWYALHGVPQLQLAQDAGSGGWKRHARCGQWNPDAPDPELFFPLNADLSETYVAQSYCAACPVRVYCDAEATDVGRAGVWGGIFRDDRRRTAALCITPGCLRYRQPSKLVCLGCADRPPDAPVDTTPIGFAEMREVVAA